MTPNPEVSAQSPDFSAELDALKSLLEKKESFDTTDELEALKADTLPPEVVAVRDKIKENENKAEVRAEIIRVVSELVAGYPLDQRAAQVDRWLELLDIQIDVRSEIVPLTREDIEQKVTTMVEDYFAALPEMVEVIQDAPNMNFNDIKQGMIEAVMEQVPTDEPYPQMPPAGSVDDPNSVWGVVDARREELTTQMPKSKDGEAWVDWARSKGMKTKSKVALYFDSDAQARLTVRIEDRLRKPAFKRLEQMRSEYDYLYNQVALQNTEALEPEQREEIVAQQEEVQQQIDKGEETFEQVLEESQDPNAEVEYTAGPKDEVEKLLGGFPPWIMQLITFLMEFLGNKKKDEKKEEGAEEPEPTPEPIPVDDKTQRAEICAQKATNVKLRVGQKQIDDPEALKELFIRMPDEMFEMFEEILESSTGVALLGLGLEYQNFTKLMEFYLDYPGALREVEGGDGTKLKLVLREGDEMPADFDSERLYGVSEIGALFQQIETFKTAQENGLIPQSETVMQDSE